MIGKRRFLRNSNIAAVFIFIVLIPVMLQAQPEIGSGVAVEDSLLFSEPDSLSGSLTGGILYAGDKTGIRCLPELYLSILARMQAVEPGVSGLLYD